MRTLNLFPVNTSSPTHFTSHSSTLLDVFFVSHMYKVLKFNQISVPAFSRHDLIHMTLQCEPLISSKAISFSDFKRLNVSQLGDDLKRIEWFRVYEMPFVDDQVFFIQENIIVQ